MALIEGLFNAIEAALSPLSEKAAYDAVAKELAAGRLDQGLWTKALADAAFNDENARTAYIKQRVAALHREATRERVRRKARYKEAAEDAHKSLERGDYDTALVGFVERVEKSNDPAAMHVIGWLIENGHVKNAGLDVALQWYEKAVEHGNNDSAVAISRLHLQQKNYREACEWAKHAIKFNAPGGREALSNALAFIGAP